MLLIKFIDIMLILSICSYLGIYKAKKFEDRVIQLNKFQNALVMFKGKVEFTYEPLKNIFEEISKIIYEDNENIFKNVIKSNGNICTNWNAETDLVKNNFNKEDREVIKMLGKMLGKTDVKGQVSEIELTMNLVGRQIQKAEKEKEKNSKLYKTMGVVCGLGICIILI